MKRANNLKTPSSVFYVNQAIVDFLLISVLWPMYAPSHYLGNWLFGKTGCVVYGFLASALGLTSLCNICVIALDRYVSISVINSSSPRHLTFPKMWLVVATLYLYNLAWSALPLLGWNRYVAEGFLMTCCFDYLDRDPASQSFILFLFLFCFALPLLLITCSYLGVFCLLRQHHSSMSDEGMRNQQRALDRELKLLVASLLATCGWLVCWTPYAIMCLVGAYGDYTLLSPLAAEIPAVFAKSSTIINPFIYALKNPNFQTGLKQVFPRLFSALPKQAPPTQQ